MRTSNATILDEHGAPTTIGLLPPPSVASKPPLSIWTRLCVPPLGLATFFVHAGAGASSSSDGSPLQSWAPGRGGPTLAQLHGDCIAADVGGESGMLRKLHFGCGGDATTLGARFAFLLQHAKERRDTRTEGSPPPRTVQAASNGIGRHSSRRSIAFIAVLLRSHGFQTAKQRAHAASSSTDLPPFAEIEISLYAPRNQEMVIRLQTAIPSDGSLAPADGFLTHDGLAWRRRGNPPGEDEYGPPSPSAAFFPTSVGVALHYPPASNSSSGTTGQQLFLLFDRSVGIARLAPHGEHGDGSIELLLHRSLMQDDGRGLMGPVFDDSAAKLKIRLLWGPPTPKTLQMIDRHILALQSPLVPLRGDCSSSSSSSCALRRAGARNRRPSRWCFYHAPSQTIRQMC